MAQPDDLSAGDLAVLRSIFDPTVTIGDIVESGDDKLMVDDEEETAQSKLSVSLSAQGVRLAEQGKLAEALDLMNQAVQAAPDRASGYNDRAQLLRLMQNDDEALSDLDKALQLTQGKRSRARALALCQRGVLLRKRGSDDEARAVFSEAAKLGSGFARKQVVELNPYAALCNQMLSQVMKADKDKIKQTNLMD